MIKFFPILFSACIVFACGNEHKTEDDALIIEAVDTEDETSVDETAENSVQNEPELPTSPRLSGKYTVKAFLSDSIGWGYSILEGTKVVVNQPHIPAIQGIKGFTSEARALRAGEEAAYKMEQGVVPPTLTVAELKALKVID